MGSKSSLSKTEKRLRWALRYILIHPDCSPAVLSEEWKISIDEAIKICAQNFGTTVCEFEIDNKNKFDVLEEKIYAKLISL